MKGFIAIVYWRDEQKQPVVASLEDVMPDIIIASSMYSTGADMSAIPAPLHEIARCSDSVNLRPYLMQHQMRRGGLVLNMTDVTRAVAISYQYAEHAIQMAKTSAYIYEINQGKIDKLTMKPTVVQEPISEARAQFFKDVNYLYV